MDSQKPTLAQINAAARRVHMSYGNFVAGGYPVPKDILLQEELPKRRKSLIDGELFEELHYLGYTDVMIAQQMCVRYASVAAYRRRLGLKPNRKHRERSRTYDG